jgi:hypothetical protein
VAYGIPLEDCDNGVDDDQDGLVDCDDPECAGRIPCSSAGGLRYPVLIRVQTVLRAALGGQ